ncbi:MAG: hypothetical protein ACRDF0_09210 [Candidatus Limnocylindria bacterium]
MRGGEAGGRPGWPVLLIGAGLELALGGRKPALAPAPGLLAVAGGVALAGDRVTVTLSGGATTVTVR